MYSKLKKLSSFILMLVLLVVGMNGAYAEQISDENQYTKNDESTTFIEFSKEDEKEYKFRKMFGLEMNTDKVKDLIKKNNISSKYGVHLSPEEALELDNRIAFQESSIPKIKEKLKNKTNGDYSIYIDQENGGIVNIGLKNTKISVDDITSMFSDKSKIVIKQVDKTEKDLDNLHEKIWNSKESLSNDGIIIHDMATDVINQKIMCYRFR
ncbi:hypothetical protein [Paenibacillus sp. CF384]|uniref:hypothetical protein n=1 Tax=Paenibacillus sp. CF384 TaxID=1884382 RepID=UPI000899CD52|nr:hypothetical protein [Paenibacillus sp. CF384]SDW22691.1 hypothetical protein SAMN05518855_1001722 [Paenibacillus sp. CF384]